MTGIMFTGHETNTQSIDHMPYKVNIDQ